MALAAQQTHVAVGKDHVVGVEKKIIVDPQSGIAAEVENVTVAVDLGDGNIAIARQQKVTGVRTGYGAPQSRPQITAPPVQQQPRVTYPTTTTTTTTPTSETNHLLHCIICLFCPCWLFVWVLVCLVNGDCN